MHRHWQIHVRPELIGVYHNRAGGTQEEVTLLFLFSETFVFGLGERWSWTNTHVWSAPGDSRFVVRWCQQL